MLLSDKNSRQQTTQDTSDTCAADNSEQQHGATAEGEGELHPEGLLRDQPGEGPHPVAG